MNTERQPITPRSQASFELGQSAGIVPPELEDWAKLVQSRARVAILSAGCGMTAADGEQIIRLVEHHIGAEVHGRVAAELPDTGERFEGLLSPAVAAPSFAIRKPGGAVFTLADDVAAEIMSAWQGCSSLRTFDLRIGAACRALILSLVNSDFRHENSAPVNVSLIPRR